MSKEPKIFEAINMYENGLSMNKIAKLLGVTGQTIKRWLVASNITIRYSRPSYSKSTIEEAIRLYVNYMMSTAEVAAVLGIKGFTVKEWVKSAGVIRSMSSAASLSISMGKVRGRSLKFKYYNKSIGKIVPADSSYELSRMITLDNDPYVLWWDRCFDRIPFHAHPGCLAHYTPDLVVQMRDGRCIVEEVKPKEFLSIEKNQKKFWAAQTFYELAGIEYAIITKEFLDMSNIDDYEDVKTDRAEYRKRQNENRRRREKCETENQRRTRLDKLAKYKRDRWRMLKNKEKVT